MGVETLNEFGKVGDFDSSNERVHLIGPMIGGSINNKIKWEMRLLAGLTSASRDHNLGFRLNYAF